MTPGNGVGVIPPDCHLEPWYQVQVAFAGARATSRNRDLPCPTDRGCKARQLPPGSLMAQSIESKLSLISLYVRFISMSFSDLYSSIHTHPPYFRTSQSHLTPAVKPQFVNYSVTSRSLVCPHLFAFGPSFRNWDHSVPFYQFQTFIHTASSTHSSASRTFSSICCTL